VSRYEFSETPETFALDQAMSWALYGQVFTYRDASGRPIVADPSRVTVTPITRGETT